MRDPVTLTASEGLEGVSQAERIFRGMLGMGMVFAVVAGAIACVLAAGAMVLGPDTVNRDGLRFILTVFFLFLVGGFGLGMGYAGLLALLARGRSFRELSVLPVATAGATAGFIPMGVVVAATPAHGGLLSIFPLASAVIATATLLIARRRPPPGT